MVTKTQLDLQIARVSKQIKEFAVFENEKESITFKKQWSSLTDMIDSIYMSFEEASKKLSDNGNQEKED